MMFVDNPKLLRTVGRAISKISLEKTWEKRENLEKLVEELEGIYDRILKDIEILKISLRRTSNAILGLRVEMDRRFPLCEEGC